MFFNKNKKIEITDAAKKLAEEANIDLSLVTGTGADNKIVIDDIRGFIKDHDIEVEKSDETKTASPDEVVVQEKSDTAITLKPKGKRKVPLTDDYILRHRLGRR